METNILLESGTNELEVLEFTIGHNTYGINVAKVREILNYQKVTPIPNAHDCLEGLFMPRDLMITVVDLAKYLGLPQSSDTKTDMFIVTNFNNLNISFHVHNVVGIHRVSWDDIIKPDETMNNDGAGVTTGIIKKDKKLIIVLDFEKIVTDISPETGLKVSDIEKLGNRTRNHTPILIAEDSPLLMKLITESIGKAGYDFVTTKPNGQEAWDQLRKWRDEGTLNRNVQCIITDIEMPKMDGHRLTKLIKSDPAIMDIPVIIFSSLINEEMRRKGESLGANRQLSKPEIGQLVQTMDEVIEESSKRANVSISK